LAQWAANLQLLCSCLPPCSWLAYGSKRLKTDTDKKYILSVSQVPDVAVLLFATDLEHTPLHAAAGASSSDTDSAAAAEHAPLSLTAAAAAEQEQQQHLHRTMPAAVVVAIVVMVWQQRLFRKQCRKQQQRKCHQGRQQMQT
jgi:hypothetical protein